MENSLNGAITGAPALNPDRHKTSASFCVRLPSLFVHTQG